MNFDYIHLSPTPPRSTPPPYPLILVFLFLFHHLLFSQSPICVALTLLGVELGLESSQTTTDHNLKENWLFLTQQLWYAAGSFIMGRKT